MLALDDDWVWDFWLATDGDDVHLFYLHAPKSLGEPDSRHHHARIGHAVSPDLRSWTVLDDALGPGATGAYDDLATWTGSVVRAEDAWWMFYTGLTRADGGYTQRILRASSPDLTSWTKDDGWVLEAADTFEQPTRVGSVNPCWRDPAVVADGDGGWGMLVTARSPAGPSDGRGVVGLLRSEDLQHWRPVGPVTTPGDFGHLEVPQPVTVDGHHFLLFSVYAHRHSGRRAASRPRTTGTHWYAARHPLGYYRPDGDDVLAADPGASRYAGKIVPDPLTGSWAYLCFRHDDAGRFVGALDDPVPVAVDADGRLTLATSAAG